MKEGWDGDDYVIVFDAAEAGSVTAAYGLEKFLPGYAVVAILGWDDFLVRDECGDLFRIPTVPILPKYMEKQARLPDAASLASDERFTGKIKWYVTPIVFNGDPSAEDNIIWVDLSKHQELVRWWNDKYREVAGDR